MRNHGGLDDEAYLRYDEVQKSSARRHSMVGGLTADLRFMESLFSMNFFWDEDSRCIGC